jgi:uncharacterized membrane protein YidH (DUF202 family)
MTRFSQVHDPGLQQERTNLAWDRTALAVMVTSGIMVRAIGSPYPRLWHLLPAVTFLVGLLLLATDRHRYLVRWERMQAGGSAQSWRSILVVGLTAVVLGIGGVAVLVSHHL